MFIKELGLYYEEYGNGYPTIFLNGIMMNTSSWANHIPKLDKEKMKIILYDSRDEGKSEKLKTDYSIELHAEDLKNFIDYFNYKKVNIVGLSYGGQIAQIFALKYKNSINKLVLVNTCDHIDNYLESIGKIWKIAAASYDGEIFFDLALPFIYSRTFYNNNYQWLMERRKLFKDILTKEWFDALIRLSSSNINWSVRDEISQIDCETMLVAGEEDIITTPKQMFEMHKKIKNSVYKEIKKAGHGLFLEKIDEFSKLINEFI